MNDDDAPLLEPWEVAVKKFIAANEALARAMERYAEANAGMAARRAHLLEITGHPDLTAVTPEELAFYESVYGPLA